LKRVNEEKLGGKHVLFGCIEMRKKEMGKISIGLFG
jgi:hypothetical protein